MKQSECNRLEGLRTRAKIYKLCVGRWRLAVGIARSVGRTRAAVQIHLRALEAEGKIIRRQIRLRPSGFPRTEYTAAGG